ncbi:uncharacterized protein C3orf22 isoform X2 [Homo sapiens]|uniref:uncharacterized protein C3orf22 isoform X2 n=1 Tax=Homo sapiens TaxID=9606 RepID=UPI0005D0112A|nr:uncharacterized protein C3orf22 isoform X2 [Homo sapiens]XP_054201337.1 uncharacterized protein C3orf22 isoform X2 [Homo sapiens]|eukprot:XP_011510757.1 uncharacterized protein C3orf22 isoform X2 [Homo sapiens]
MDSSACKKSHQSKKWRIQAQENFAKKFPYRLSWLTEPDPEPLQPWEVTNDSNTVQLPLQKRLVPTRSIPVRGVGVRIKKSMNVTSRTLSQMYTHTVPRKAGRPR